MFSKICLSVLMGAIFVSALQLVVVRHQNRILFSEIQKLQQQRDMLTIEWGRLQLEQSTWAQHNRIETLARQQLNMTVPAIQDVVVIHR